MRTFLTGLAALFLLQTSAAAQDSGLTAAMEADAKPAPEAQVDVFDDAFTAMTGSIDEDKMIDAVMTTIKATYAQDPYLGGLDESYPGFLDKLMVRVRPVFKRHSDRISAQYRPQFVQVFRDKVTADEAEKIAAFYRSPLGLKLIGGVSENYSADQTIDTAVAQNEISAEDVKGDMQTTVNAAIEGLSKEDLTQLGMLAIRQPELMKLSDIGDAMLPIRVEMEREPLSETDMKELFQIIGQLIGELSE